jgi:predicted GIY-YIG superfamily endonuclease
MRPLRCLTASWSDVVKYVYILESLDSEHFYVGITDDLRARLKKHNAGEVTHTSKFRPWSLHPAAHLRKSGSDDLCLS